MKVTPWCKIETGLDGEQVLFFMENTAAGTYVIHQIVMCPDGLTADFAVGGIKTKKEAEAMFEGLDDATAYHAIKTMKEFWKDMEKKRG